MTWHRMRLSDPIEVVGSWEERTGETAKWRRLSDGAIDFHHVQLMRYALEAADFNSCSSPVSALTAWQRVVDSGATWQIYQVKNEDGEWVHPRTGSPARRVTMRPAGWVTTDGVRDKAGNFTEQ